MVRKELRSKENEEQRYYMTEIYETTLASDRLKRQSDQRKLTADFQNQHNEVPATRPLSDDRITKDPVYAYICLLYFSV